jgi:hypothetical protein
MSKIRKAIAAFVTAAAGSVVTSIATGGIPTTGAGWAAVLGAAAGVGLVAALAVYGVRNAPAVAPPADASVRRTYQ